MAKAVPRTTPLPSITVAQYAGIQAALGEGFPLEQVLEQEGVPDWRWPGLDIEMVDRITEDPAAFKEYGLKLTEAEDWLRRTIDPLDGNLEAWTGFLAAYADRGERMLAEHGLAAADVSRLQRAWGRRFDEDEALRRHAAGLKKQAPAAPTRIQVGAFALRPFPWSPPAEEAMKARALEPPPHLAAAAAKRKRAAKVPPTIPAPPARPAAPVLEAPVVAAPVVPPPAPASLRQPQPSMASPWAPNAASLTPARPVTPWVPPTSSPAPPSGPPSSPPSVEDALELSSTAPADGAMSPLALPFAGKNAPPPKVAGTLEPVASLGSTAPVSSRRGVEPKPQPPKDALAGTILAAPPSSPVALPFAGNRPAPPKAARSLEPLPELGKTAPAKSAPSAAPLPFAAVPPSAQPPRAPNDWTPEDYGRYCAELDVSGSERAPVLTRWRVRDDAEHEAIARQWVQRFQADPALRQRFAAALEAARKPKSSS